MKLIQIYECLCDETRLRILNLLQITPLCVSHLQKILEIPQVKVTKHLAYMRERGMVEATRHENWMLYTLCRSASSELDTNLKCLQDCSKDYAIFNSDMKRLKNMHQEIAEVIQNAQIKVKK
ncbi:MAG: metalloregulator ArsR/SmtB family transcription factor [Chlamydiales bacterium]|nr:metalloregulator ArsR/SmtB family transcription factor [Chlamydiales bacterium]